MFMISLFFKTKTFCSNNENYVNTFMQRIFYSNWSSVCNSVYVELGLSANACVFNYNHVR